MKPDPKADPATLLLLERLFPKASRADDARQLGISRVLLDCLVAGSRRPNETLAQTLSGRTNGRLVVSRLRWWKSYERPSGCRIYDTDPMPLAVAEPGHVSRDRESVCAFIVYLEGLADDPMMPAEHRDKARELAAFLRQSPVQGVRP